MGLPLSRGFLVLASGLPTQGGSPRRGSCCPRSGMGMQRRHAGGRQRRLAAGVSFGVAEARLVFCLAMSWQQRIWRRCVCCDAAGGKQTNRGEPAMGRGSSRRKLVFGWPHVGPDHEAVMRFGTEAPGWRAHTNPRFNDHVQARVTTTSDRNRQSGQGRLARGAETVCLRYCIAVSITPAAEAPRRAALRRY